MRHIGRIITTAKIEGITEFIDVTKDESSVVGNEAKIPTLIIGYKNAERICGPLKMTEKKIGNNLWWTFSKRERRIDYEPDLESFLSNVSDFLMKFCNYEYIDPITWEEEKKTEFFDMMTGNSRKILYKTPSMYYVYFPKTNNVYGLSMDVLRFTGLEGSIMESMSDDCTVVVDESSFRDKKMARSKFVMPILYYLKNF